MTNKFAAVLQAMRYLTLLLADINNTFCDKKWTIHKLREKIKIQRPLLKAASHRICIKRNSSRLIGHRNNKSTVATVAGIHLTIASRAPPLQVELIVN